MIIGISGKIGSGKDTLAQCIQELDPDFENKKFAYKLKLIAKILTGVDDQWTHAGKECYLKYWGMTIRELQQRLGTEALRDGLHPDVWVLALFVDWSPEKYLKWVVTDVRYPNEAEAIKERGGYLVRINGTRFDYMSDHSSETSLDEYDGFDYIFDNSSISLDELRRHASRIVSKTYIKAGVLNG